MNELDFIEKVIDETQQYLISDIDIYGAPKEVITNLILRLETLRWLIKHIQNFINDFKNNASNEHIWALESLTQEEAIMHENNAEKLLQTVKAIEDMIHLIKISLNKLN